jgi:hypothetical protein
LRLSLRDDDGSSTPLEVPIDQVVLVGYTGRDRAAVLDHIHELETLGVAPPARVPAMYPIAPELVTTEARLVVNAAETSGEAEFFILPSPRGMLVGVGSDHTDRAHEAIDVAASKARCGKVISREVWRLDSVEPHWDALELRAWTTDGNGRVLYQEGRLEALLAVPDLIAEVQRAGFDSTRQLIFGGTLPTLGGFAYGSRFEVELNDPVLRRSLRWAYDVVVELAAAGPEHRIRPRPTVTD